jgi:hypothetical protein
MGLWGIAHYLRTLLAIEGVAWSLKSLHASQPSSRSSLATLIMYGSRPAAYSAPRLSPVPAYGRRLLLYAAALSTPSTSSCECGGRSTAIAPTKPVRSSGAWCGRRSGIKEEPEGRGGSRGAVHTKRQSEHRNWTGVKRQPTAFAPSESLAAYQYPSRSPHQLLLKQ